MLVKALVSFSGRCSMYAGEKRELEDKVFLDDLIRAGYIEVVKQTKKGKKEDES